MSHARPFHARRAPATLALATLAVALTALGARTAGAQAAATTGFHAGQNALEADVGASSSGIAYAHFTSADNAFVVRFSGTLSRQTADAEPPVVLEDDRAHGGGYAALGLGTRHLRPIAERVAAVYEFGVEGQYGHFAGADSHFTSGLVYGELGGQYALAPNFSLGVLTDVAAFVRQERFGPSITAREVGVGTRGARARATFYF